jgi:aspartyl aminopeptidase
MKKSWQNKDKKKIFEFAEGYKSFISENKTERECVISIRKMAEKHGFINLNDAIKENKKLSAGDKVYAINIDKCIMLFTVGKQPMQSGLRLLCAHIDSPRIDFKPIPLYESADLAMIDTHYYGGIKKYQWTAIPLALHGVVCKKDGSKVYINIGEKDDDPVFCISDLLPHLDPKFAEEGKHMVNGENLDMLIGGIPLENEEKEPVKKNVLKILSGYGIEEDDFISAEIEIVPAGKARDMGLDRSFILGYGQDDRICAYTALTAIIETENPKFTTGAIFVDKEEIGSVGASGMQSRFFEDTVAEIIALTGDNSILAIRRCLRNSLMLSNDVTAGYDPNYESVYNKNNDAHLGKGVAFCKYTGSKGKSDANDASPEYIAKLRQTFDKEDIGYQFTEMGKIDQGGGGTIAYIAGNYGMNVIDGGCALLNMHAPWEISSKVDIYEAHRANKAFLVME